MYFLCQKPWLEPSRVWRFSRLGPDIEKAKLEAARPSQSRAGTSLKFVIEVD
jgi:hypothetical protein